MLIIFLAQLLYENLYTFTHIITIGHFIEYCKINVFKTMNLYTHINLQLTVCYIFKFK